MSDQQPLPDEGPDVGVVDDHQPPAAEAGEGGVDPAAAADPGTQELDVETLVTTLETVTSERDSHLEDLQRITAEFANFRRQATKRQSDTVQYAASGLAEKLLPVLDACDAAIAQGAADVAPIQAALLDVLQREGLEPVTSSGQPFDPERHEAVSHEAGDGEAVVIEVMRAGYVWNSRVLRPAMVRVKG